jgi:tryptophan-rich sensory protein
MHSEWYRIFVKERRVALGAMISVIGFVSLLRMVSVVALADKVAAIALIPSVIASLVSSYMNAILYYDHYLPSTRPARSRR